MNLRDLEYLVAVADRRTFRQAALACEVSQPTLSTQIKKLEGELGVTLIDRTLTPLALTYAGERIVARARVVLDDIRQIREVAASQMDAEGGAVRLGFFPTLGPYLLPHVLGGIQARFPSLELLITEEKSADLLAMLESGALDAVALALPVAGPHLHVETLFREEFLLVAPAGHALSGEGSVAASDVVGHEILLLAAGHCLGDQVSDWLVDVGAESREDYRASSLESMRTMVRAGAGITLLPALTLVPPVAEIPGVTIRRFIPPAPSRDIALVWRRNSSQEGLLARLAPLLVPNISDGLVTPL